MLAVMAKRLAVFLICACGKSSAPSTESDKSDWSAKPLDAKITSKVGGVAFEVSVPKGWIFDSFGGNQVDDDAAISKNYRPNVADYYSEPSLELGPLAANFAPTSLDEVVSRTVDAEDALVSKRALPDGYLVVTGTADGKSIKVHVQKHKGATWLGCQAMQRREAGVPSPAATTAWLGKICESLIIK